jgi:hypothetical protein
MSTSRRVFRYVAAVALVGACSGDQATGRGAVDAAPASAVTVPPDRVEMVGASFEVKGSYALCGAILESDPPQCGDEIAIEGTIDGVDDVELRRGPDVALSAQRVVVTGVLDRRTLSAVVYRGCRTGRRECRRGGAARRGRRPHGRGGPALAVVEALRSTLLATSDRLRAEAWTCSTSTTSRTPAS